MKFMHSVFIIILYLKEKFSNPTMESSLIIPLSLLFLSSSSSKREVEGRFFVPSLFKLRESQKEKTKKEQNKKETKQNISQLQKKRVVEGEDSLGYNKKKGVLPQKKVPPVPFFTLVSTAKKALFPLHQRKKSVGNARRKKSLGDCLAFPTKTFYKK